MIPSQSPSVAQKRYLILIRHPKVADKYRGVCYGQADVPLASGWEYSLLDVLTFLRRLPPEQQPKRIWNSGLQRTISPSLWLARQLRLDADQDCRLKERDFGSWQSKPWDAIPQAEVMQSHAMLDDPMHYRPGGGETTSELQRRSLDWLESARLADPSPTAIVAIAHSGSITTLAGGILSLSPRDWTPYYLKPSQSVAVLLMDSSASVVQTIP